MWNAWAAWAIGIEPDAIGRIFDAFAQANERISREFGGLGLGLAISKTAVENAWR